MRFGRKLVVLAVCAMLLLAFTANTALALSSLPATPLRPDSEGEPVRILQRNLIELKLYTGKVTGLYDADTAAAVRKLQALLGLPEDDALNAQTINAFNQAVKAGQLPPPAEQEPEELRPLSGRVIGIDPGHQKEEDPELEPVAPGSKNTKPRMSAGGAGAKTGIYEYETNLLIANRLKKLLEASGATVVMTRTKHDVNISNAERAEIMNKAKVDCWVRVHCDFSSSKKQAGVSVLVPSEGAATAISEQSLSIAKAVLPAVCEQTGARQLSIVKKSDQTAFNWSNSPVICVEFGFLSNPNEDVLLNRAYYQAQCAQGVHDGLSEYFSSLSPENTDISA